MINKKSILNFNFFNKYFVFLKENVLKNDNPQKFIYKSDF